MGSDGIYLSDFFHRGNPFVTLGIVWFMLFSIIGVYTLKLPAEARFGDKLLAILARVLPSGLAAFTGWIAFAYMWVINWKESRWDHLIVVAVAFLGITGFLPRAIWTSWFFRDPAAPPGPPRVVRRPDSGIVQNEVITSGP
jgi:hypothetical protein